MAERPDMSCVPFAKKKTYYLLTLQFLALLLAMLSYLWTIHIGLVLIFFSFYVLACVCHASCCAYQDCPYIDRWCSGVAGIIPASRIGRMVYGKSIKETPVLFALFGTIAFCSLVGSGVSPLYWLAQRATWLAVAYFTLNLAYYTLFLTTVCPACAIRNTCPGGKCHQLILKGKEEH